MARDRSGPRPTGREKRAARRFHGKGTEGYKDWRWNWFPLKQMVFPFMLMAIVVLGGVIAAVNGWWDPSTVLQASNGAPTRSLG